MIRDIEKKDAPAIQTIVESAMGYKTTQDIITHQIEALASSPESFVKVYEDDETNEVKGYIQAQHYPVLYGETGWNVIGLAVLPAYQKQGIGKQLMQALEQHASEQNECYVRLSSRIERHEAHAFYEHIGYKNDKTQKRFTKKW